jgi:SWI/SNF-related matrix-associated actin-dependent regulator of chromatin subfamily A protein 2/4
MIFLHRSLYKLNKTKHRILLFCQMTKCMDILEEYLEWKQYKYLRLDGASDTQHRK